MSGYLSRNEPNADGGEQLLLPSEEPLSLTVTMDVGAGVFHFEWLGGAGEQVARGQLSPANHSMPAFGVADWQFEHKGRRQRDRCNAWPASTRALLKRIQKLFPSSPRPVRFGILTDKELGVVKANSWHEISLPGDIHPWKWLERQVQAFCNLLVSEALQGAAAEVKGRVALEAIACAVLGVAPSPEKAFGEAEGPRLDLRFTLNQVEGLAEFIWSESAQVVARGCVTCTGPDQLTWTLSVSGACEPKVTSHHRTAIRAALKGWLERFPTKLQTFRAFWVEVGDRGEPMMTEEPPFGPDEHPYPWIEDNLVEMAEAMQLMVSPQGRMSTSLLSHDVEYERYCERLVRKEKKQAEQRAELEANMARMAEERRRRELRRGEERKEAERKKGLGAPRPIENSTTRLPLPPVTTHLEMPPLEFQETAFPLVDLAGYSLRERASLWWISNQSDDLLCLPHCHIERLEYQLRTVLRVLGPLRGRALLSDEVGLGKTIEAGLVIKELLTRGMVKRFLVLTVPSLVDQWEQELREKFGLATATTNHGAAREDMQGFWTSNTGIVASLHTLKQAAQLQIAREVHWDILVVDEAHYLKNRDSQAWQAVNGLSRQFLLLLTATPVQNSLEELYNLVTLLQPGQLPTPKEFRARYMDVKRPRQAREPEELRRLLGQVMIRNTRANAGVQLPPRRAETVVFQPDDVEMSFWKSWEPEFRASLASLNASQASLWGRLILQAVGSSPAAWRAALAKFPDPRQSANWRQQAPLDSSWRKKCNLIPPLTQIEGGAVIFTQFLDTQAALAEFLRSAKVETFVINGSTPASARQPITEEFRKKGGALLLTHSGTEGRNLQFSHRLVNFDLPWNPMEIEQRIGRLHRLGQQHPVRIYNFVQAGTLQEHLLEILQEKLNLFELVVGETGLVLGDRFSSDEFAEEILHRWRESEGRVAEALATFGEELAAARGQYDEIKKLDQVLFAKDYESV